MLDRARHRSLTERVHVTPFCYDQHIDKTCVRGQLTLPLEYWDWRVYETVVDDDMPVRRVFSVIDGDGPDGSMRRIGMLHIVD